MLRSPPETSAVVRFVLLCVGQSERRRRRRPGPRPSWRSWIGETWLPGNGGQGLAKTLRSNAISSAITTVDPNAYDR